MPGVVDGTTAQNIVTAINTAFQNYLNVQGVSNSTDIASAKVVKQGNGRVATVVVTVAGSAVGAIYDGNTASVTTGKIYVIPMTVGVQVLNMPVKTGIVVVPGSGQTVSIGYS